MNRHIIVAVIVVAGSGVVNAFINKKPLTPVILGAYIFFFVLALTDMYGGPASSLAGGLAMLAMTYILLTEVPWNTILHYLGFNTGTEITAPSPQSNSNQRYNPG